MKMKNSSTLIITSVLCLLPLILSFAVYNDLPEQIAIHWDSTGNPDNYFPKALAAFGLPFLFLAFNIFSKLRLYNDPKRANVSKTMRAILAWLIPFMSIALVPITLFIAMGVNIPISIIVPVFTGIVLIVFGNYLPKSRQNYAVGIKLPWTLHNADNWNKTHRMAGYLYMLGGAVLIALTFISFEDSLWGILTISIVILLIVLPILYSYSLYKKNDSDRQETDKEPY